MKTTINPKSIILNYPPNPHKSLVLVTTPSQLNKVIEKSVDDFKNSQMRPINQIIVACIDSILGSRDAYSELYLDSEITVNSIKEFKDEKKVRDPLSVDPIKFDKNWNDQTTRTSLSLNINNTQSISLKLANSLFSNGEHSTCFYIGNSEYDWMNLSELDVSIEIPTEGEKIEYHNRLTEIPLVQGVDSEYTVTSYEGNLIKSIDDKSPSQYLIDNPIVMGSKKDLYFKLYKTGQRVEPWNEQYYKLIVGGLGWGEKQAFLGVDPIVGEIGHRNIKMYEFDKKIPSLDPEHVSGIVIECPEIENGYVDYSADNGDRDTVEINGGFAFGCEDGFVLNGVSHKSQGEVINLNY